MGKPFFSVLMPSYNHENFQPQALDSLLAQTFTDWEALVVDDGSTDGTAALIDGYAARDQRIRAFHKSNGGTASALNEALRHARSDWVLWLSADDLFEADKLAVHRTAIDHHPEAFFFHTDFSVLDQASGVKTWSAHPERESPPTPPWHIIRFFQYNYVNGISVALRRTLMEELGGFRSCCGHAQDYDLWLRASILHAPRFIDHATCVTRTYPGQASTVHWERGFLDAARVCSDFLDRHPFQALFPELHADDDEAVGQALRLCLGIMANRSSIVWMGGLQNRLVSRILEFRDRLGSRGHHLVDAACREADLRDDDGRLAEVVGRLLDPQPGGPHRPMEPFDVIRAHAEALAGRGHANAAARVRRYVELHAPRTAP